MKSERFQNKTDMSKDRKGCKNIVKIVHVTVVQP